MLKCLVFDKDGSLYSASKYITPFAEHLSRLFDRETFMDQYHDFRSKGVIGENYNIETLIPDTKGKELISAFWVPALIALHNGFDGSLQEEFQLFSQYILNDSDFPHDSHAKKLLSKDCYKKVLVSNENKDELLKKLGLYDLFDLKYLGAGKDQNLELICDDIEDNFNAVPSEIIWVEDDLVVLERLKKRDYQTVLRKTKGFNYVSEDKLHKFADLVLDDSLLLLYELLNQNVK
ncbi:MAG: HAD family hydrolase [Nanoarchaeota archaeon]|nr:HAD family hydrolase [Nanoarchaeota archaeon]MBU1854610.1 HAD family hydrolase [Nanoarchaeota archaeon]